MSGPSILFPAAEHPITAGQPEFFHDLNLDQLIAALTAGRELYDLTPLFHTRLRDVDAITYRHELLRDLDSPALVQRLRGFARQMRVVREHQALADKLHHPLQQQRWFLDAVESYCTAVQDLRTTLTETENSSRALANVTAFLDSYLASAAFTGLLEQTAAVQAALASVRYTMQIHDARITVSGAHAEPDYEQAVLASFEKFEQGAVRDYRMRFDETPAMDHVEAQVLEAVAKLNPDAFAELDRYCAHNRGYVHATITTFDRELQFYLSYLEYFAPLEDAGLSFCLPEVSVRSKEIDAEATFDLVLAAKLVAEGSAVVRNDMYLHEPERVLVISGPNQGGKTTLARTFGQLHYLAALGLPVPGHDVRIYLYDQMFTHFERGEDLDDVNGKLQDDLLRVRDILQRATPDSVVIMNEIFNSTTLQDAIFLGTEILNRLLGLDLLGACVTFIDELAELSEKTVSMVSTVVPDDPAIRTFTLVRRPADGRAYAAAIAEKYGLSYAQLTGRVAG